MSSLDMPSFVGRGISFPMRVDSSGSIALDSGAADIEKSMRVILSTAPGERPMRPYFGCAIWDLLFEPINANTLGLMEDAVRDAMSRWEPRAVIDEVIVRPDETGLGAVTINIGYTIRSTNDRRNLVHPFYLIPGEGDEGGNA
ncbi:MAG: GPW/gp25 family protein [Egicoccus sp.]